MSSRRFSLTARILPDGKPFKTIGRDGWALQQLIAAGKSGCTPITHPGPRWSSYVHKLRRKYRLDVETVNENHGGQFSGSHARYILRSQVEVIFNSDQGEVAKEAA